MKKLLFASTAALALTGSASAADLAVGPVAPVLVPTIINWTGCYVGGFAGVGWADTVKVVDAYANVLGAPLDTWSYKVNGSFLGGGTLGCNWQPLGSPFVLGIEGEAGFMKFSGAAYDPSFLLGPNFLYASAKIGNGGYGMVTGRLGYAVDRVLFYIKGGAAFLDETATVVHPAFPALGIPAEAFTGSNNNYVRWTVGGGIEWALGSYWSPQGWSIKGEYMFIGTDNNSPCGFVSGGPILPGNYCWSHSGLTGVSTVKIGLNYRH